MKRSQAIAKMRQILLRRRDALRSALAGELGLIKSLEGQTVGDSVDAALDAAQGEINSQLAEVESRELTSIRIALQQMRLGEYGRCQECNISIPLARLRAVPYATLCVGCQRDAERSRRVSLTKVDWRNVERLDLEPTDAGNDMELNNV